MASQEDDVSTATGQGQQEDEIMSSFARPLKSRDTDLEIAVGPEGEVFHCHSVIMASYSEYIDSMLSSPMKESTTMSISFPDIEPQLWKKMMKFLEPGGSRDTSLADISEMLPVFDEYRFGIALATIDNVYADYLEMYRNRSISSLNKSIPLLSYQYELPRSKEMAVEYVRKIFTERIGLGELEDQDLRALLPMIHRDEEALREIFSFLFGMDKASKMELAEMVEKSAVESFAASFRTRCNQVYEQIDLVRNLNVKEITVDFSGVESINGEYQRGYSMARRSRDGAMCATFSRSFQWNSVASVAIIRALDPFGKKWQIGITAHGDEENEEVIYEWECDYSSLVPPKYGWRVVDETYEPAPKLRYYCDSRSY